MERIVNIIGAGLIAVVIGAIVMDVVHDPMNARREYLKQALADIHTTNDEEEGAQADFEKWNSTITGKQGVWEAMVPPPPPPAPPAPPPPQAPNLGALVNGIKASRQKVGDKIKIITPENPKGAFFGVGDAVGPFTVQSFDKTSVTLAYDWKEGKQTLTQSIPRE